MKFSRPTPSLRWYVGMLLLAASYAGAARLSLGLAFEASNASPIWPPSGIALAALLLGGQRLAPGIFIGALLANLVAFLGNGAPVGTATAASAAIALGNTVEALVAARWTLRLIRGPVVDSPQGAYLFAAVALAASTIAACGGVATLTGLDLVPGSIAPTVWLTWWLGDATGLLIVTPALVQLARLRGRRLDAVAAKRLLPTLALFALAGGLCFGGLFADGHVDRLLTCLLICVVAWSTFRHGRTGAVLSILAVASLAVVATLHGQGPFAKATTNDSLISLDVFLALCALTGMVLSTTRQRRGAAAGSRGGYLPTAMLLCSLAGSVLAWHLISRDTERRAVDRFEDLRLDLEDAIRQRMQVYQQALQGGRGLFDASAGVGRDDWRRYVTSLEIDRRYPGVQGMGFAAQVSLAGLPSFLANARADNGPGYAIWPAGERPQYTNVLYLEPPDERNRRAVGFDLSSEPARRAALDRARDSGEARMSAKVTLKQEFARDVQAGFLIFVPVYRRDWPIETVAQRRAALAGFVYSPFRMGDLIRGVLRPAHLGMAQVSIYDGDGVDSSALMFTNEGARPERYPHQIETVGSIEVAGHPWTIAMSSTHAFEASVDTQKAQITLVAGAIISLLLFTVVRSLTLTRQEALALAARMTEARTEAQTRFQSLAESASEGILVLDSAGRIEYCNRAAARLFGCAAQAVVGRDVERLLMLPLSFADWRSMPLIQSALPFGTVARVDDGRSIPVEVSMGTWSAAGARYFSLIVHDVSRRRQTEEALQYELRLRDVIFRHAGVGIASKRDRRFGRVSRHCTALLGYEDGELDGQPAAAIYPDSSAYEAVGAMADELLPAGRTLDHELFLRRKDGSTVWCRIIGRAVDPADPGQGTIWIIDDFSDRRQRETLLRDARAAAEDAVRLKAEFLANMSHEIRTPMNGIIGMTRLTLETALDDTQRENLLIVQDSADALLRLLDDILDFSKMEAGKLQLAPAEFDLRERLASTLESLMPMAVAKGLDLVLDVAPDVPGTVRGDAGRLMQVVTNLCGNAVKFTARGQVVCRVGLGRVDGAAVTLDFAVVDSGIGIPKEAQARIFESFVQADSAVTRQYGGTGLGLAICTQIVHLMNGEIAVDSVPGAGTTFSFSASFDGHSAPPALSPAEAAAFAGRSVLLVQGNAVAAEATARLLRTWALEPLVLPTRAAAIASARLGARHACACPALLIDAPMWSAMDGAAGDARAELPAATNVILLGDAAGRGARDAAPDPLCAVRKPLREADLRRALLVALGAAAPPERPAFPAAPASATRSLRILVAEDHPINQTLARRLLERRGHQVVLVADGAQAVEAVATHAFDVVLMDVQMPVLDGVAATRAIRRAEESAGARRIPIIALTAHALKGERERLLCSGMDDYLSKPFEPADLVSMVERHVPSAAGPAAQPAVPGQAVYDHAGALAGALGDSAFLDEMAQTLAAGLPDDLRGLAALVHAGDLAAAARAAHRMKGAVGNFHANASMRAAARLEAACDSGDPAQARAAFADLENESARLLRALANRPAQETA